MLTTYTVDNGGLSMREGAQDAEALARVLDPLHPADIADLLEQLDPRLRTDLVHLYGIELDGEVLSELDESIREDIVAHMAPEVLAEAARTNRALSFGSYPFGAGTQGEIGTNLVVRGQDESAVAAAVQDLQRILIESGVSVTPL